MYLRQKKSIVHYHTWGGNDSHRVEAVMAEGPLIFASSILSGESPRAIMLRELLKVEVIRITYFPLCKLEELYWSLS